MSKRSGCSSNSAVKFVKGRVQSNQGISLQELNDHLSRLPSRMMTKCGNPAESLRKFLRQFPKVFVVGKQGKVYVRRRKRRATSTLNDTGFVATTSHSCTDEDDVPCLTDVTGKVYCIFSVYGFISVKSLRGDCVTLGAKVGPKECEARFRASQVTRATVTTPSSAPCPSLHGDNNGGQRNIITRTVDQYSVVEMVKPRYGFIKFGRSHRERAIFHAGTVDTLLGSHKVPFNAKRIKTTSGKVRWEATTVHFCRSDDRSCAGDSEGQPSGNEVFKSGEECDIQDVLQAKLDEYESREAYLEEPPAGCAEWDANSVNADSSISSGEGRKLAGERGFFYPVSDSVGTVKFGHRRGLKATAAVEVTYRGMKLSISIYKGTKGTIVKTRECSRTCEVRERTATRKIEFTSGCFYKNGTMFKDDLNKGIRAGDTVCLDYMVGLTRMREEMPCGLVWHGRRPRGVWRMSAAEFGLRLQIDTQDAENLLSFEDLETEIERTGEASRGPFRVPSDIEQPVDTLPSMGIVKRAARPLWLAYLPLCQRQRALLPTGGPLKLTKGRQHVAGLRSYGHVFLQLARMEAVEFVAQKESLRVALRDGVQNADEGPSSRQDSKLLVYAFVNASTQTVSTVEIKSKELFIN
ncbi:hypothetical protein HPB48_015211 [Haemaphysalis longicornis]|uniref:Egal-1 winged helix domain-containing protein n=1 Tax=Haemaphysalis longicornis TaxID=44386 RepID=A0A9J6FIE4_HAELO|nr:hypothetical protein HPB48_015211 [Haemaphysalis longicornis]